MIVMAMCLIGTAIALFSCKTNHKSEAINTQDTLPKQYMDSLVLPMQPADITLQIKDKGYIKNGKYYSEKDKKVKHPDGLYSVVETIFDGISQGKDTIRITLK